MRLIIVANRLPISIKKGSDGTFTYTENSGGLVSGLKHLQSKIQFLWIGNISGNFLPSEKAAIRAELAARAAIPVFVPDKLNEDSYNMFCNSVLWPLLHSFGDDLVFTNKAFEAYKQFNAMFCDEVVRVLEEGDILWVHDYHLMLLPKMVRDRVAAMNEVQDLGFARYGENGMTEPEPDLLGKTGGVNFTEPEKENYEKDDKKYKDEKDGKKYKDEKDGKTYKNEDEKYKNKNEDKKYKNKNEDEKYKNKNEDEKYKNKNEDLLRTKNSLKNAIHRPITKETLKIGFFLHTPFPEPDVFNILPYRKEIIQSLISTDLIGFHTYEYVSAFKKTCLSLANTGTCSCRKKCCLKSYCQVEEFDENIPPDTSVESLCSLKNDPKLKLGDFLDGTESEDNRKELVCINCGDINTIGCCINKKNREKDNDSEIFCLCCSRDSKNKTNEDYQSLSGPFKGESKGGDPLIPSLSEDLKGNPLEGESKGGDPLTPSLSEDLRGDRLEGESKGGDPLTPSLSEYLKGDRLEGESTKGVDPLEGESKRGDPLTPSLSEDLKGDPFSKIKRCTPEVSIEKEFTAKEKKDSFKSNNTHSLATSYLCRLSSTTFQNNPFQNKSAQNKSVREKQRLPKMEAVPIGTDPLIFRKTLESPATQSRLKELRNKFMGRKIILGVDRTDYIKGIPNRIEGYNRALSKYPELVDTSVFIQIGVPSRENVNGYRDLVTNIKTAIADLNSAHGPADSTLAHFLYSSVPFDELCALYAAADVCLVSSLVDGMNLVSMEFISCQEERQGVLILSEFAGSLSTLPGSIKINPYDLDEIADSIKQALEMGPEERKRRFEMNFRGVKKFDGIYWAEENLKLLRE